MKLYVSKRKSAEFIVDDNNSPLCRMYPKANAAHIVHCVNSHDALVEALTECVADLRCEIEARYGAPPLHPALQRKYNRDMWIVEKAEKLIKNEVGK